MQTHCLQSTFGIESWSILSDIERSIKKKVETVGIPLSEWDVQIYRGILTGYNDAFIISSIFQSQNCLSLLSKQSSLDWC